MKEVMHLIGDFHPDTLKRWTDWATLTNHVVQHSSFEEVEKLNGTSPLIILDDHGLNDAQLPE